MEMRDQQKSIDLQRDNRGASHQLLRSAYWKHTHEIFIFKIRKINNNNNNNNNKNNNNSFLL